MGATKDGKVQSEENTWKKNKPSKDKGKDRLWGKIMWSEEKTQKNSPAKKAGQKGHGCWEGKGLTVAESCAIKQVGHRNYDGEKKKMMEKPLHLRTVRKNRAEKDQS